MTAPNLVLTATFPAAARSNRCARKRGPGLELQMATRRAFMKGGAMALVGTSVVPTFLRRSVLAQATSAQAQGKKLVVIFQRGAADGLNIVVPHAESGYYQLRPSIAIPQNQLIDLDGFFGLHPAMQSLKPLF